MFFKNGFDVSSYVNQRMLEIEDLKERAIYKELTEKILVDLFEYQTKSYQTLYENVTQELISDKIPYSIDICLTKPERFDASDQFLFPMSEDDLEEKEHSLETILNTEIGWSRQFYYNDTYINTKNFQKENAMLSGKIITDAGEFPVKFSLTPAKKYMELLKNLRKTFAANGKPWSTVCTAHLERLFHVTLIPEFELPVMGELQKVLVDLPEENVAIHWDVFPLWNISHVTQTTSSYPTPALDKVNYEHLIFAHRLEKDYNYLAENSDVQVSSIYFKQGDLVICSQTQTPIQWELLEIAPPSTGTYEYEIFTNRYDTQFTDILKYYHRSHIKTKQELKRFLKCLPYGSQMEFLEMNLVSETNEIFYNYDMDSFIIDEIRQSEYQKKMVLTFESKRLDSQFDLDILSFLVSQVQGLFPEYTCVGKLKEESP